MIFLPVQSSQMTEIRIKKDFFLEKVKSLNADYLNLIKKEEKHIKSFENDVYPILKEIQ